MQRSALAVMNLLCKSFFALTLLLVNGCAYPANADICVGDTFKVSKVVGHVVAIWKEKEQPVSNVRVELKQWHKDELKTRFTTKTDETGYFHFDKVASGTYEIEFTPEHFYPYGGRVIVKTSRSNPKKGLVVTVGMGIHFCASAELRNL